MSSDTNWRQLALIGVGLTAVGGILYYFWSPGSPPTDGQNPAPNGGDDDDDTNEEPRLVAARLGAASRPGAAQKPASGSAGPKLPPQPRKGSRSSPSSGQSSNNDTEEQKHKSTFAEAVKKDAPADKADDSASASTVTSKQKKSTAEEAPQIAWSQTQEEVTIWINISADVRKQHIGFKLTSTHIVVEVQGDPLLAGTLPFPVQPDDSNWQFDTRHQQRVLAITLQKAITGNGLPVWGELIQGAPGTSVHNTGLEAQEDSADSARQIL